MAAINAYLAPEGFEPELLRELGQGVIYSYGRLILAHAPEVSPAWVQNVWYEPQRLTIASIKDGARQLKAIQRNWALYDFAHHRRAALITGELPKVSAKPLVFPSPAPAAPLGSWTLLEPDLILAAPVCTSAFPNGEVAFIEDKIAPPSRAYLKLWEALTLAGMRPAPGDLCLDLGASPGGWTWVLQQLGARVIAVDKAPLEQRIETLPEITVRRESAFGLDPRALGPIDWLCSDVICYPARLYALVTRWIAAGTVRRFVCTLKFQGDTDFETIAKFQAIPGSRLIHLSHNKHELTWLKL
jgi:23S rRNA (cytidine2498-2'-O)-methyltransferase